MKRFSAVVLCALMVISTLAGSASAQGVVTAPSGICLSKTGELIFTDVYGKAVYQREGQQKIAGMSGADDAWGEPQGGYVDASAMDSRFGYPWDIVPYLEGYAVSDSTNNVLRYISDGKVQTIAGSGKVGSADGQGTKAQFARPTGMAVGADGSIFVADTDNSLIRMVSKSGAVTTFAGSVEGRADGAARSAKFNQPTGVSYENGILYVADTGNHRICKIENGVVTTIAGSADGTEGYINGKSGTLLSAPQNVLAQGGKLYIADSGNSAVRLLENGYLSTVLQAREGELYPVLPRGLAVDKDILYVADAFARRIIDVNIAKPGDFADVAKADLGYADIMQMAGLGILAGTGNGNFTPDRALTRSEAVTVLYRLEQVRNPGEITRARPMFDDVADTAFYGASVTWAAEREIAVGSGKNGRSFVPAGQLTRADWACMAYRYCVAYSVAVAEKADLSAFADVAQVPKYAEEAVAWALGAGVLTADADGKIDPAGAISRGEMAQSLNNIWKLM